MLLAGGEVFHLFLAAGVAIGGDLMAVLANPLALGIIVGLVVGKPLGICLLSWLAGLSKT